MLFRKCKYYLDCGGQLKATSSTETHPSLCERKHSLSANDISCIDRLIQQQPDITIHEVTDTLQLHACDETVRKVIVKLGYVSEQDRPQYSAQANSLATVPIRERHRLSYV